MATDESLIYLFSSNIRPLYVQDILDVAAAPAGSRYRFRYEGGYVAASAQSAKLSGRDVLVVFAIQQEAQYHAPAFIPVRRGELVSVETEAGIVVYDFKLKDYVALKNTTANQPSRDDFSSAVQNFTEALGAEGIARPYDKSASAGADIVKRRPELFASTTDPTEGFNAVARTLQRTDWFRDARFVRFLSLATPDGKSLELKDDAFHLNAGSTYQLELAHYQPAGFNGRQSYTVSADGDVVQVIGRPGFDIASRYDIVRLPMHARLPGGDEARETVVAIEPTPGVQGPSIRLNVRVSPPIKQTAKLAAMSATVLILFGLPAVLTGMAMWLKFVLVFGGAILAALFQHFGLSITSPFSTTFGSSSTPADTSTPSVSR